VSHKKAQMAASTREYLVLWQGYSVADATWEPESNLLSEKATTLDVYWKSVGKVVPQQGA
jgi:hypothetical protein